MKLYAELTLEEALGSDGGQGARASHIMVATIGGIISGSMFGDHVSPISDTTVLTAICTQCPIADLVRCQAMYCLLVLLVSVVASLVTASMPESVGLMAYPVGFLCLYLALLILSTSPGNGNGGGAGEEGEGDIGSSHAGGMGRGGGVRAADGIRKVKQGLRCEDSSIWSRWCGSKDIAGERDGLVSLLPIHTTMIFK